MENKARINDIKRLSQIETFVLEFASGKMNAIPSMQLQAKVDRGGRSIDGYDLDALLLKKRSVPTVSTSDF